jgi:hypothetical protein
VSEPRCRGCNRKLIWAKTQSEKGNGVVPLDAVAPVYVRLADGTFQKSMEAYVSHFATCPNASEFSGSKKEKLNV